MLGRRSELGAHFREKGNRKFLEHNSKSFVHFSKKVEGAAWRSQCVASRPKPSAPSGGHTRVLALGYRRAQPPAKRASLKPSGKPAPHTHKKRLKVFETYRR